MCPNSTDVLNRFPIDDNELGESSPSRNTVQILMYMFPQNFGLHNVFTCYPNSPVTTQNIYDYTFREDEINFKHPHPEITLKIPKRLRGKVLDLIKKMRLLHKRCPYKKLLDYYCPVSFLFNATEVSTWLNSN